MTLDDILVEINHAEKIVIMAHETPDGDAIGSMLSMNLALKKLGKEADVIVREFPRTFDFLPGAKEAKSNSDIEQYDLAISLDCADLKRLVGKEYFESAKKTIVIDHHGTNMMYGDLNFVNPVSPACCEILAGMFEYFDIEIDSEIGSCILTGIITDTGGFKYSSVTPETFEFTAELLRKGVNVSDIYQRVLETRRKSNFELLRRAMNRLELLEDGKIAFTYINKKDEEEVHAETGDHEGIVENGRSIEGVRVSVFIREKEENIYKVSMRAGNGFNINVSDICYIFGGGGHPRAAGAVVSGTVEQVKEKLVKEIKKVI